MKNETSEHIGAGIVFAVAFLFFLSGAASGSVIAAFMGGAFGIFAGLFLLVVLSAFGIIYQDGSSWFR
jgi:hypothetical protein